MSGGVQRDTPVEDALLHMLTVYLELSRVEHGTELLTVDAHVYKHDELLLQ